MTNIRATGSDGNEELRATHPDTTPPTLRWHVDEINDSGVIGWIFAPGQPGRRCVVTLQQAGRLRARATASRFRPGLREAGIGDGHCAFMLPLPRALLDGEEHLLHIVEEASGTALTAGPVRWRSAAGTAGTQLTALRPSIPPPATIPLTRAEIEARTQTEPAVTPVKTRLLFDLSDLVHYLALRPHLTGLQRVQVSVVLALLEGALPANLAAIFISYNDASQNWEIVPINILRNLLRDLFLPQDQRRTSVSAESARAGHVPGAQPFDAPAIIDDGTPLVLCLLGAGWNRPDYFHKILAFKRRHGARFVMLVHDLISINAPDTCDPHTAQAFALFLRAAARHVDHFLAVSHATAGDLRRFVTFLGLAAPAITVTRNGSTFDEFLPARPPVDPAARGDIPARFVLYVSTIEGRKNHIFLLDLWRRMIAAGENPPHLVCVGQVGWRAEPFVTALIESNYLNGLVILRDGVSDADLRLLYQTCLFTVYPSSIEGWGLPVGESLAAGKVCVCSRRAALPEVAGSLTPCLDLDDPDSWLATLRNLVVDEALRRRQEMLIRNHYRCITWSSVAAIIAGACDGAATAPWPAPYPLPVIPYATEISFAQPAPKNEPSFGHFLPHALTEVSFVAGEEARADGIWAAPEPWGTWLCQSSGSLALALGPCDDVTYYLCLRVRTSAPVAGAPATISSHGQILWDGRCADRPQDIIVGIRRPFNDAAAWRLNLQIAVEVSAESLQQIRLLDARGPVIGFERMMLIPESDLRAWPEILTTLQNAATSARRAP